MTREIRKLRQNAEYLRHCASFAERSYVAPSLDEDDEGDEPLHVRLRTAAIKAMEAVRFLEDAEEVLMYAEASVDDVLREVKSADWCDEAYEGFCDSMAA